jgi:hypothetical protein
MCLHKVTVIIAMVVQILVVVCTRKTLQCSLKFTHPNDTSEGG